METINASCHCGKIELSFSLPVTIVVQCHCQNCRKMQGGDYSTWIAVSDDTFVLEAGSEFITHYKFNGRSSKSFCSLCGTAIFGVNEKHFHRHKMIPLGSVDNGSTDIQSQPQLYPQLYPQLQVYTEDKAEWVQIQEVVPALKQGE